jgi:succinoglycan biosynthesis protein ExoM
MTPDVSICVATCRRPAGLARLLESLGRLEAPEGLSLELIVVDNDPDASAAPVLAQFRDRLELRSFAEPRRNIAHARNRALEEARGRWIAFIDDDEVAEPGWLAAFWRQAREDRCDGFAGPVLPVLERNVTPWLAPDTFFGRPDYASGAPLGCADLNTSNAFLRAALFEDRRFDARFGLRGGSDTELFARMQRAGARFCWCGDARVREYIPPRRHCLSWLSQRAFRGGFVHTLLEQRRLGRGAAVRRGLPRALAALALFLLSLPLAALAGRSAAARVWLRGCTQAGHLWALLGRDYQEYGAA